MVPWMKVFGQCIFTKHDNYVEGKRGYFMLTYQELPKEQWKYRFPKQKWKTKSSAEKYKKKIIEFSEGNSIYDQDVIITRTVDNRRT